MSFRRLLIQAMLVGLVIPALACRSAVSQVTPTPTKTPKIIRTLSPLPTPTLPVIVLPTDTPLPTFTPTPAPPTPTPEPTSTETPTPEPTPTDVPAPAAPPPPPPPTATPAPPPPTAPPAPPPPTAPPASSKPEVIVQLPDGNQYDIGDEVKVIFIVRDPDGVKDFTWGFFTQNQTSLKGGKHECGGQVECILEVEEDAPPIEGTFIVGADALDTTGQVNRGIGEIYVTR